MKTFLKLLVVVSSLVLVGCGGGGGSSTSSSLVYEGKTEKVNLDETSVKNFLELVGSQFTNGVGLYSKPTQKMTHYKSSAKDVKFHKVINEESRNGAISGSVREVKEEIDTSTHRVTTTFSNFSDYEGIVLDGKIIATGTSSTSTVEYVMFTQKFHKVSFTANGKIRVTNVDDTIEMVQNLLIKDNQTSEIVKYDNYKIVLNSYGYAVTFSGKIYHSDYGYVDVSTLTPLEYNELGEREAAGEILLDGNQSATTIKYAHDNRIRVEIDEDKDGAVDKVQVFMEGDYVNELPNAAPVIAITFPKSIYTNTDMSEVTVDIYDPDLDGFTSAFEWHINGNKNGDTLLLNNNLFKKHDVLKLTASATDDRVGENKASTEMKEQTVLNSAPVVSLELNTTEIQVGQKILIDASKSYDVDGDAFTFEWNTEDRKYNIYDSTYNLGTKYLDINESNKSIVKFIGTDVNYDYIGFGNVMPYGVSVILDDKDMNGTSITKSEDINVTAMDVFEKDIFLFSEHGIDASEITTMAMGDLNNDGLKDIVIATGSYNDNVDNNKLIVLEQNLTHGFYVKTKISLANISPYDYNSIKIADLNNDGVKDIAYTSKTMRGFNVFYQKNGSFETEKEYNTRTFSHIPFPSEPFMVKYLSNSVEYLSSADMNNDGKDDIVTIGFNSMAGSSTGMNIFLQNDINLTDSQMLVLDNRTIHSDGDYVSSPPHAVGRISISDIDSNGLKDMAIANYLLYQENNGSYSEKSYEVNALTFSDLDNDSKKEMIGIKSFERELHIHNLVGEREYALGYILETYPNAEQVESLDVDNNGKKDLIVEHNAMGFFTLLAQDSNGSFYGSQIYSQDESLNYGYHNQSIWVDDLDNDGVKEIIYTGRQGFEILYRK